MIDANISNIGTKHIQTHNPATAPQPPFKVRIPPDKGSSKQEAQGITDTIQVFTDGSILDDKVGVAAILTRPGKSHRLLHYQLGNSSEYTIFDAELAGLSMGMYLIKTEKAARHATTIGADNQEAIRVTPLGLSCVTR
jgi:hypothetical protein